MSEEYEKMDLNKLITTYMKLYKNDTEKKFPWNEIYNTKEGLIEKLKGNK